MTKPPASLHSLSETSPPGKVALLTFDAEHPDRAPHRPDALSSILNTLASGSVHATFFLQGRWASANPVLARRVADEGHTIGSHCNAHVAMTRLSDEGITAEVVEAQERIAEATGLDPRPLFRCPYGDGHEDERVVGIISRLGYRVIDWDIDPQDWDRQNSATDIFDFVTQGLTEDHPSPPIVLLHTWPAGTPDALPEILSGASDAGVTWAAVDEVSHA